MIGHPHTLFQHAFHCILKPVFLRIKNYGGSIDEFQFASYIMQDAKYLRAMKICIHNDFDDGERLEMMDELSSCMKSSDTCTLSFI